MTISTGLWASIVGILVAVVAFLGGMSHEGKVSVSVLPDQTFGAAGNVFSEAVTVLNGITIGGKVIASTTVATETLNRSDIDGVKLLNAKAAAASTLTLPTNALLSAGGFLPNPGDTYEWFVHASTSVITLSGGSGVALQTVASSSQIFVGRTGKVTFIRLGATEGRTIEAKLSNDF